jgi:hypothetical protein
MTDHGKVPFITPSCVYIKLGEITDIAIVERPLGIKSKNARPNDWVYVDIESDDVGR